MVTEIAAPHCEFAGGLRGHSWLSSQLNITYDGDESFGGVMETVQRLEESGTIKYR